MVKIYSSWNESLQKLLIIERSGVSIGVDWQRPRESILSKRNGYIRTDSIRINPMWNSTRGKVPENNNLFRIFPSSSFLSLGLRFKWRIDPRITITLPMKNLLRWINNLLRLLIMARFREMRIFLLLSHLVFLNLFIPANNMPIRRLYLVIPYWILLDCYLENESVRLEGFFIAMIT